MPPTLSAVDGRRTTTEPKPVNAHHWSNRKRISACCVHSTWSRFPLVLHTQTTFSADSTTELLLLSAWNRCTRSKRGSPCRSAWNRWSHRCTGVASSTERPCASSRRPSSLPRFETTRAMSVRRRRPWVCIATPLRASALNFSSISESSGQVRVDPRRARSLPSLRNGQVGNSHRRFFLYNRRAMKAATPAITL